MILKYGPIPASFCLFSFFSYSNNNFNNINWRKHRWCAWVSNPGPQDGRRNHGAMAAAQHNETVIQFYVRSFARGCVLVPKTKMLFRDANVIWQLQQIFIIFERRLHFKCIHSLHFLHLHFANGITTLIQPSTTEYNEPNLVVATKKRLLKQLILILNLQVEWYV